MTLVPPASKPPTMMSVYVLILSLFVSLSASVRIVTSPASLTKSQYDFIVAGGGTAGLVVATRLTEDPGVSVLVVEGGIDNRNVLDSIVPFLAVQLPSTPADWNFTTTPQRGLFNRVVHFARGHILGGSSSINIMTYNRGSNDVYDRWARLSGDPEWSWPSVEKYYRKNSRLVAPADGHNTTGEVNPAVHGDGPVEVSVPGFPTELDPRVINSSKVLNNRFKFTEDLNAGEVVGFSLMQSAIGNGSRSSAATAYLDPLLDSRPNLDVLINTQVTRLIQSGHVNGSPEFKTAEIGQVGSAKRTQVHALKEMVLSAGVIGSAKILKLSGIGPKAELDKIGVSTILDIPSVGANLTDHPLVPIYFSVNSNTTFDDIVRNTTNFNNTLQLWNTTRQGLFVDSSVNTQGYLRLPANSTIFQRFPDPSAGPLSAHTELLFADGFAPFGGTPQPSSGHFMTVLIAVVSPLSRGTLTLNSSDPFDKPLIDPQYLTSDFDIFAMVQGMKDAETFIKTGPWAGFIGAPFGMLANATTDDLKAVYARNTSVMINHSVGTVRMSPVGAKWGAVNPDLLVKGTAGLRVVDASVFPAIPECHTQAPTYILAERASDIIKAAHGLKLD